MYRVIAILSCAAALAACSSSSLQMPGMPDMPSMNFMRPQAAAQTILLESEPAGAEAKVSLGPSCRTPCSVPVSARDPFTVTFALSGYQPQTVPVAIQPPSMQDLDSETAPPGPRLTPNPVYAELAPAPPPPRGRAAPSKSKKKAVKAAKAVAKRTAPPRRSPASEPEPTLAQQPPSPWPVPR